ncbi:MAG: Hsp20/alpha crystallin family protein [Candidatus Helarchaeota archaeon]
MPEHEYDEKEDNEKKRKKDEEDDEITWVKHPKWDEFFGMNFPDDFEIPNIEKIINQFFKQFNFPDENNFSGGPIVWGFSMTIGPDKKPIIKQIRRFNSKRKQKVVEEKRDAMVDVIENDKEIIVIAEISGVKESDIKLKPNKNSLKILVDTDTQKYFNEVSFQSQIEPQSIKFHYSNGILEVTLKKKQN